MHMQWQLIINDYLKHDKLLYSKDTYNVATYNNTDIRNPYPRTEDTTNKKKISTVQQSNV